MATTQAFETLTVPIAGMDCEGCATHIRKAIAALPGVETAEVQLGAERAIVRLDPTRVGLPAIHAAIAEAGYRVASPADPSLPPFPSRQFRQRCHRSASPISVPGYRLNA